jgi:hypothetical protein
MSDLATLNFMYVSSQMRCGAVRTSKRASVL